MSEGLLPCPFCGSAAEMREIRVEQNTYYIPSCLESDPENKAKCRICGYAYQTREEAVIAWNRRTPDLREAFEAAREVLCFSLRKVLNGEEERPVELKEESIEGMRRAGLFTVTAQRYKTFEDWQASRGKK